MKPVLVLAVLLVACTSPPEHADLGAPDEGLAPRNDQSVSPDQSVGPDLGGSLKLGSISVSSATTGTYATATFSDYSSLVGADLGADPCTTTQVGAACNVTVCGTSTATDSFTFSPAGTITIKGTRTIALTADSTNSYEFDDDSTLWTAGQTVTVTGTGATVPAFTGSFVAPAVATITTPALGADPTTPLTVARSSDLVLAWTGGAGTSLSLTIDDPTFSSFIGCTFDVSATTGTVPSAALQMLAAGPGYVFNALTSSPDVMITAGAWSIDIDAYTDVLASPGMAYTPTLTLQ